MKEAIQSAFSNYANFKGRATRPQFWWFFLFLMLVMYIPSIIGGITETPLFGIIGIIAYLGCLIPYLAVAVRRLHDCNKSGWFIFVPIYNLILLLSDGDKGINNYGNPVGHVDGFDFDNTSKP
jgi:uncharacterized membrane protein YhaH (DUF805 family)